MRSRLHSVRNLLGTRESAQIMVLFAVFIIVLLVLAGSAYDYASIVVDEARLQNAVDAAALAGSDTLSAPPTPGTTPVNVARTVTAKYLSDNHVDSSNSTIQITPLPYIPPAGTPTPNPPIYDGISVSVQKNHPTAFWPLVGVPRVTLNDAAQAHGAHTMIDVMLSLDTTGSLVQSGNLSDYHQGLTSYTTIADAVVSFVNEMNPVKGDPRGVRIGIGRYAGVECPFVDDNSNGVMEVYNSSSPLPEYRAVTGSLPRPCVDDETLLTSTATTSATLTDDKQLLLTIANNSGTASCPDTTHACPIQHAPYSISSGLQLYFNGIHAPLPGGAPYYTGTKEPNALCLVNPSDSPCIETPVGVSNNGFAWLTANGGRNSTTNPNDQAHRVLVIMTDGQNEGWPTALAYTSYDPHTNPDYGFDDTGFPNTVNRYDSDFLQLANDLKTAPPDGGPPVEIYVVGFFCAGPGAGGGPSSFITTQYPPQDYCGSSLAYVAPGSRACPGPSYTMSSTGSTIDDLLVKVSSSVHNGVQTCDHYFPLSKGESLPTLFTQIAGSISRGQLTQ